MLHRIAPAAFAFALATAASPALADVVGQNVPAPQLTAERIAELPPVERRAWSAYLARSERQMRADRASIERELRGLDNPPPPPSATHYSQSNMPLDRDASWYASAEARAIADTIVSFQTPAGGWSKNQNRAGPQRMRGQRYSNNAETMNGGADNFDTPRDVHWTFVGTLDNEATTTEMRFLARVAAQAPGREGAAYRASFIGAVNYLLNAQYPNGGWPQTWPLDGGFHDGVTFNDDAMTNAIDVLDEVARGEGDLAFVPASLRARAAAARDRGMPVILAAQIVIDGKRTGWPQQVNALTLEPMSARNYEPPSLASGETASLLNFLMRQPNPSPEIRLAVRSGVDWLRSRAIYGLVWGENPRDRRAAERPGAGPIWARYYSIETGLPIFGDRDKSIHDDVNDISIERRNGYSWYSSGPQAAIDMYADWAVANPD